MIVYCSITSPDNRNAFVVKGEGHEISDLIRGLGVNDDYFFMNFMVSPMFPCELSDKCKVFISLDAFAFLCDEDSAEAMEFLDELRKQSEEAHPAEISVDEFDEMGNELPMTGDLNYIRSLHDLHCSYRAIRGEE